MKNIRIFRKKRYKKRIGFSTFLTNLISVEDEI